MRRSKRHQAYREQQLALTAMAAGESFGWSDDEPRSRTLAEWHMRRRIIAVYAPVLFAAPFMSSVAWYFYG